MDRGRIYGIVRTVTKYVGLGIGIAVVSYVSVALSVSTENEKRLMSENQALKEEYENLREKMELVGSVISDLEVRDRTIYRDVFNADLPAGTAEPDTSELQVGNLFDKSAEELVWETYVKGRKIDFTVSRVNGWLQNINANLLERGKKATALPSILPIADFELMQTGASTGQKFSPFFKTLKQHDGMDIMAPIGTDVLCTADGTVTGISRSARGLGNTVTVTHTDGYKTVYAHLGEISVPLGRSVRQGTRLGKVGISGSCFAACLHYEVWKGGLCQDPVFYFFANLDPVSFRDVAMTAMTTGQAMD